MKLFECVNHLKHATGVAGGSTYRIRQINTHGNRGERAELRRVAPNGFTTCAFRHWEPRPQQTWMKKCRHIHACSSYRPFQRRSMIPQQNRWRTPASDAPVYHCANIFFPDIRRIGEFKWKSLAIR